MSITPIEKVLYTAKAHTAGGRDGGGSRTSDGRLDVKFSLPGTPGTGTNPNSCSLLAGPPVFYRRLSTWPPQ